MFVDILSTKYLLARDTEPGIGRITTRHTCVRFWKRHTHQVQWPKMWTHFALWPHVIYTWWQVKHSNLMTASLSDDVRRCPCQKQNVPSLSCIDKLDLCTQMHSSISRLGAHQLEVLKHILCIKELWSATTRGQNCRRPLASTSGSISRLEQRTLAL
jgi:hypothetical protein